MGHQPRPMPTVTREQAIADWNRREAERELQATLEGKPYTYRPPREEWYHEGRGFMVPPTGGSSIQRTAK